MDAPAGSDVEAYFIAPPFFVPELVASRAPGLAAARGMFQLGLFINAREVGFDSLEEIIALVRRVYSSRGMWPGPEGGLPPAPPPPDSPPAAGDAPPRSPPMPSLPSFKEHLERFIVDDDTIRISRFIEWPLQDEISDAEARQLLVAAGIAIVDELIRRTPSHSMPEDLRLWRALVLDLYRLCYRLGIAEQVFDWVDAASRLREHFKEATDFDRVRMGHSHSVAGLYDLFERLPLPKIVARDYAIERGHDPSLLTLVSAYCSHAGARAKTHVQLEFALLMFAGACATTQNRGFSYDVSPKSTVSAAFAWCKSQLPTLKFYPAIEKIIREAPVDWYRFEMTSRDPSNGPGSGPLSGSRPQRKPRPGPTGTQQGVRATRAPSGRFDTAQDFDESEEQSHEEKENQNYIQLKF
ncbi:hypothetical protein QO004_005037 [Rhizobium mesoamericanum]|uniref:hypothetical protein n=1 Tax=Rhizobium mesoamericanum TaxID=1079800 RepID=UPI0027873A41|nr:hypothetical protein [Rhizobium mesoamericanum]MDQ0563228.1 hypothetical protein [Rhizobium mesoamericanum]